MHISRHLVCANPLVFKLAKPWPLSLPAMTKLECGPYSQNFLKQQRNNKNFLSCFKVTVNVQAST